jgi:membrane protease subunit HflC
VAVVTLFGKMEQSRIKTEPGAYLQWPWPIEQVFHLDQRVHSLEDIDKLEYVALPDQNIILLQTYAGWRIAEPAKFFPRFADGSISKAEDALAIMIRSAKLEVAGRHNFSDFLSADEKQMKLSDIENEILARVRDNVRTNDYGIEVKFVQIRSIELPESDTSSVFNRMKDERGKVIAVIQADALLQSNTITAQADLEAARLVGDGEALAKQIRGEGEAAMVNSLQILREDPPLAKFIMDLGMLEELSKDKTTWILDSSTPGMELLQVPKPAPGEGGGTK